MLLDGPMDGNAFVEYVKQVLSPELKEGDMVICDNLSSHKVAGVREAIEARGAELLYLPAYSPDLNPIEMAFSTLKAILRQQAQRSFEGLLQATSFALDRFSPNECINFFNHANYASYYRENAIMSTLQLTTDAIAFRDPKRGPAGGFYRLEE